MSDHQSAAEIEVLRAASARQAKEGALVLSAVGIPHRLRRDAASSSIFVVPADAERAFEQLARYQRENSAWPPARLTFESAPGWMLSGTLYVISIAGFHRLALERAFGLTGGDVYHGKLSLDQMFSMRPHPRAAAYHTPIDGLYLCGAGAHPGGGVSGAPGHNAARRVLKDLG